MKVYIPTQEREELFTQRFLQESLHKPKDQISMNWNFGIFVKKSAEKSYLSFSQKIMFDTKNNQMTKFYIGLSDLHGSGVVS